MSKNKVLIIALGGSLLLHFLLLGGWRFFYRIVPQQFDYLEFLLLQYRRVPAFDQFKGAFSDEAVRVPGTESLPDIDARRAPEPAGAEAGAGVRPKIEVQPVRETQVATPAGKEMRWLEVSEGKIRTANVVISYKRLLQELIIQYLVYPRREREQGTKGVVVVSFVVYRDGKLKEVEVPAEHRSPVEPFNAAAVEAVRTASAYFPPFPTDCTEREIRFVVKIHFE
jgi:TonB family protein